VNDPKRPNTNPAMAMAAMSVIAMRITVARTGDMAFLFRPFRTIFIGSLSARGLGINHYESILHLSSQKYCDSVHDA
jgi:hypothetical protein